MLERIVEAPNIIELVKVIGLVGILAVIFAESGLFFGFFLPGDSLLFAVGVLTALHFFSLPTLLILVPVAAITGDAVGYVFGKKMGSFLYKKETALFFKQEHLQKAEVFYKKHGSRALVIARFIPVIRTFVPIVAGVARMEYKKFAFYNMVGGVLWSWLLLILGYFLGSVVTSIDVYLLPIIFCIVILSLIPVVFEYIMSPKRKQ